MATKLSKPSNLSKSAVVFFLLLAVVGCQQNDGEHKVLDRSQLTKIEVTTNQTKIYLPLLDGQFDQPLLLDFSSGATAIEDKIDEIFSFLATHKDPKYMQYYGDLLTCEVRFVRQKHVYLECQGLGSARVGLYREKLVLYSLLRTLFELEQVMALTFFAGQQYAEVLIDDLILPKVIDRDFMTMIAQQLPAKTWNQ